MNLYHVCTAQDAHPSLPRRTWLVIAGSEDQAMALLSGHDEERADDRIERVQKVRVVENDCAAVIGWMGAPFPGVSKGAPDNKGHGPLMARAAANAEDGASGRAASRQNPPSDHRTGRWVSGGQSSLADSVGVAAHTA